ncbi:MAG: hypothetical protein V1779_17755 [bacterium]
MRPFQKVLTILATIIVFLFILNVLDKYYNIGLSNIVNIAGNEISDDRLKNDVLDYIINRTVIGVCGAGRNKITIVDLKVVGSDMKDETLKIQAIIEWDESYGEYIVNRPCQGLGRHRAEIEVYYRKFGNDWRIEFLSRFSDEIIN